MKKRVFMGVLLTGMLIVSSANFGQGQIHGKTFQNGHQHTRAKDMTTLSEATVTVDVTSSEMNLTYPVVDTNQNIAFDDKGRATDPKLGNAFFGQDANYEGEQASYTDNRDGTITDNVTGLIWQKSLMGKMTYEEALNGLSTFELAGYDDWRLPTIKELYSLIQFSGTDPFVEGDDTSDLIPFIDTDYFGFEYGDTANGERIIDAQYLSSTKYVGTTMNGDATVFGVNFADGRIKGYPIANKRTGEGKEFFVLYVRGNEAYGQNNYIDNGDGTITDTATGLMWMQVDSGSLLEDGAMNWEDALRFSEDLTYANYTDWRLPNAKELQSIVDYSKSPQTTGTPAISDVFKLTEITDEGGGLNYGFYWTGTTHYGYMRGGISAVYIAFGEALGYFEAYPNSDEKNLMDVHGAGAQRSDNKSGEVSKEDMLRAPQGDVQRVQNMVICVRTAE